MVIILLFVFFSVMLLVFGIYSFASTEKLIISKRLQRIKKTTQKLDLHDELNLSLHIRIIKPILNELNKSTSRIMPSQIKIKIEEKLRQAGNPFGVTVERWINFQLFLLIGLPVFTLSIALMNNGDIKRLLIILLVEVALAFLFPRVILKGKIRERKEEIERTLPDVLDLLTVSVEAGLGFDSAIARVIEKMPGQLTNEFEKALQEIKVGTNRKEALRNLTKRVDVPDLVTFVNSIIQAEQLGVSIGNVLRIQSKQMRQKRRQRAQEKAMKAPVKMLFPMLFFIFPTIFAVLLGPVAIRLMENFSK